MPDSDFDFFLSHHSRDKQLIEQFAERLLEERGLRCWIDVWSIPAASDWEREIGRALDGCRGTLVFLGQHGWGPWHLREAQMALERSARDPKHVVLPVLLPGADEANAHPLAEWFARRHRLDLRAGIDAPDAVEFVASSLQGTAPFPLGRPRLSPYVVRRDARRWNQPSGQARRATSRLYRGAQLDEALSVSQRFPGQLDELALEFLEAAQAHRATVRARWMTGTVTALIVTTVLLAFALQARRRAEQNAAEAARNEAQARARLAAHHEDQARQLVLEGKPEAGLHIAAALELGLDTPDLRVLAGAALRRVEDRVAAFATHEARVTAVAMGADGEWLATGGEDGKLRWWSVPGLGVRCPERQFGDRVSVLERSKDGLTLLVASYDGTVALIDVKTCRERILPRADGKVATGRWSHDGAHVAVGDYASVVSLYDVDTGLRRRISGHAAPITDVSFAAHDQSAQLSN